MASAKTLREILSFAGKNGSKAAKEKYGADFDISKLREQMKRDSKARKATTAEKNKLEAANRAKKKQTSIPEKDSKQRMREDYKKGLRNRPDDAETSFVGSREKGAVVKRPDMSRKKARDLISEQEVETGPEFMRRLGREAEQGGVGTGRPFSEKDVGYTADQISDMMRGRYKAVDDVGEAGADNVPDLVDMLKEKGMGGRKRGGRVAVAATKKKSSSVKIRGCGAALRGFGKAISKR
jgi:hypothetical protein